MKNKLKVVIAFDSFKGSLTSLQAGKVCGDAVKSVYPDAECIIIPLADGGEGTVEAFLHAAEGYRCSVHTVDAIGRSCIAGYAVINDGNTAVIEVAAAIGLPAIQPEMRNPLYASSRGAGELVADAVALGCRQIIIGLGGSATNDGGMGMLSALGYCFTDRQGNELTPCGASLVDICNIEFPDKPLYKDISFIIACDVSAPFVGPQGATAVFGPQKGATDMMLDRLEKGMKNFASVAEKYTGCRIADMPGAGAAGGLGGAFMAFLRADRRAGADLILRQAHVESFVRDADLVISGEGRLDTQTSMGKLPARVADIAKMYGKPCIAFAGSIEPDTPVRPFTAIYAVTPADMPLEEAMLPDTAVANLAATVHDVLKKYKIQSR